MVLVNLRFPSLQHFIPFLQESWDLTVDEFAFAGRRGSFRGFAIPAAGDTVFWGVWCGLLCFSAWVCSCLEYGVKSYTDIRFEGYKYSF